MGSARGPDRPGDLLSGGSRGGPVGDALYGGQGIALGLLIARVHELTVVALAAALQSGHTGADCRYEAGAICLHRHVQGRGSDIGR